MIIGWLQDDPGYVGGAELTAREVRAAAPEHVQIVDCPPGQAEPGLDLYIVHNCMLYAAADRPAGKIIRFIHDERGPGPIDSEHRVFYSPLQRDFVGLPGELCPAPIDRERFQPNGVDREGTVHVGTFGHRGKGQRLLAEYAQRHGPISVYGTGRFLPEGANLNLRGPVSHDDVPSILQAHERFVHLPTRVESYGRGVAEAWATGCELIVNENVGCLYWLRNDPDAIDTAAERFWELCLNA